MVSVKPKDITKPKSRERKDFLLAVSKGTGIFVKGLERRIQHRIGTKVEGVSRSCQSEKRLTSSSLGFSRSGA